MATEINWVRMMRSDSTLNRSSNTSTGNDDERLQLRYAIKRNVQLHCGDFGVSNTDTSDCNDFIYRVTFRESKMVTFKTELLKLSLVFAVLDAYRA